MSEVQKEKIAFVVVRYGLNINGGAEYHCRMLAERLTDDYEVEVLTTCVQDYMSGGNVISAEPESINGVLVRRFEVAPVHFVLKGIPRLCVSFTKKLRMFLYGVNLLSTINRLFPEWQWFDKLEEKALQNTVFYSPSLNEYIKRHKDEYKAFIAMTIDYAPFYYTGMYAGEKTIAIPTMHPQKNSFRLHLNKIFARFAYVGYNSEEERKLGQRVFGNLIKREGIISVGVEDVVPAPWEQTRRKYNLPDEYLLYVGRVDWYKVTNICSMFLAYKKKYPRSRLKLVMVGALFLSAVPFAHPDIVYTGFVSDEEKTAIIQHSIATVNPSRYESLSLILLESLKQGKMMLVNGRCAVLKDHCRKSGYAADYYMNEKQFIRKLHRIVSSEELRNEKSTAGKRYVKQNYDWDMIMSRLRNAIESVGLKEKQ